MKKAEGQHKDIMDTIRQIELMEKRWREAEANRHMERALELEKRKLRGGPTTPSAELPKVVAGGLRRSAMPPSQLLRPGSTATASHAADSSPRPVSMLAPMPHHHQHHLQPHHSHSQPSFPAVALTSGQSAAAVVQTGPHHGSTIGGAAAGAGAQCADDVTLENLALRRQLQSVTQENLQLKKDISSASEEIARLMAKVDELSRQWAKSSPRVIRRPTTVMLTPRAMATSGDGPANGGQAAPPPSRLSRKVLLVDQKLRFSEQQIPVSVISAPQDEWRQTLKARRRISIVPKRFIHGTGRKWKPPSLLEDEIDSLDDNWKLLFGHEVSHAKLQELESVSTKLQMRLRDENLMFAGLERLLKSYEKIEDQAGVDKTRRELTDRRAKIDLKTRVFEEMLEKKQEMLHALDSVPPTDSETVDTHTLSSSSSGVDNSHNNNENDDDDEENEDDDEEVEWVEWDEEEVEWVEQQPQLQQPTPTSSSSPTSGGVTALSPQRTAGALRPTSPPASPASTVVAGSSIPRTASGTPVSPGRASPQKGAAARPVSSFAHFGSSPSLPIRQRVAASPSPSPTQSPAKPASAAAAQQTYAAAAAASSPSTSTSSNYSSPSRPALSTRASSRPAGVTPPSTPLPPVPSGAAAGIGAKTAGVGVRPQPAPRPASSFTPSSSSSAAITARSALKPALPVKPASLTSSPSSSPYSSPSSSHTSVPTHHRPALGSASSSSSSLGGRLAPGGGSSPSSSSSPPSSGGGVGGARAPTTATATATNVRPTPPIRAPAAQPTYGSAVVTHDFVPESHDELALTRGEKVILRERIDDNWWEGEVRGQVGIFPHAFIQVLSLPAASSSSS